MSRMSRMSRLPFVICVTMSAATVGCQKSEQPAVMQQGAAAGSAADRSAADRHAIDSIRATMIDAMQRGDARTAASLYDTDAIFMGQADKELVGQPAILASFEAQVGRVSYSNVNFTVHDVSMSGNLAVETGRYAFTLTPKGGNPMPMSGKYVVVLRKRADGTWKLIRDIGNDDPPAPKK